MSEKRNEKLAIIRAFLNEIYTSIESLIPENEEADILQKPVDQIIYDMVDWCRRIESDSTPVFVTKNEIELIFHAISCMPNEQVIDNTKLVCLIVKLKEAQRKI